MHVTYPWKATPISVKNTSRFLPLRLAFAASRTLSSISQHATHGSVFTLANEKSSLRGLKSFLFCLVSCADNHAIIPGQVLSTQRYDSVIISLTIGQPLGDGVCGTFDSAYSLVIEHHHFTAYGHGTGCQRQKRHAHILLPKMTYEVNSPQHCKRL